MCGIWGVIPSSSMGLSKSHEDFLLWAAQAGAQRGVDGCGQFFVDKKGFDKTKVVKKKGNPYWLLYEKEYGDFKKEAYNNAAAVVGHNRAATRGKLSDENTHPFKVDHITLVHNGTLRSGLHVPVDEVDSKLLCQAIAEKGVEDAIKEINGAWTLVWHDANQKTLNFLKNGERPLCLMRTNSGDIYFASKRKMLEWLLDEINVKDATEIEMKTDVMYSYDFAAKTFSEKGVEGKKYTTIGSGYSPATNGRYTSYNGGRYNGGTFPGNWQQTLVAETEEEGDFADASSTDSLKESELTDVIKARIRDMVENKNSREIFFRVANFVGERGTALYTYTGYSVAGEEVRFNSIYRSELFGRWLLTQIKGKPVIGVDQKVSYRVRFRECIALPYVQVAAYIESLVNDKKEVKQETPPKPEEEKPNNVIVLPDLNTRDTKVSMADGHTYPLTTLLAAMEESEHKCMSCTERVERHTYVHCQPVFNRHGKMKGLYCPACTDLIKTSYYEHVNTKVD